MTKELTLHPHLSEKTYGQSANRVYVLEVPKTTNKHAVGRAVEAQFEVKVAKVRLANIAGKSKRSLSLSGRRITGADGRRSDFRKAYVTLAEGNSLPFFEAIEEEIQKEAEVQQKVDKVAEKQATKTAKKAASATKKVAKPAAKTAPKTEAQPKPASSPETAPQVEEPKFEETPKPRRGWRLPSLKKRGRK